MNILYMLKKEILNDILIKILFIMFVFQIDFVLRVGQFAWVFILVDDLLFFDDVQIFIVYDIFMYDWLCLFYNSMCGK